MTNILHPVIFDFPATML